MPPASSFDAKTIRSSGFPRNVRTENRWGNEAVSIRLQQPIGQRMYLHTLISASHYRSVYGKDDFVYTRITPSDEEVRNYVFPFRYRNELIDLKWAQNMDVATTSTDALSFGYDVHYYAIAYEEASANRPSFGNNYYAMQTDGFVQYALRDREFIGLDAGVRSHFFTQGMRFVLSPRLQATFFPKSPLSLRLGFSRNYQFLHNLYLQNTTSSSIWIMTTGGSEPTSVDNVTAGLYARISPTTFLQVEAYDRSFDNVRRHEINAPTQITTSSTNQFTPWFSDNEAFARGLETMLRQRIGPLVWTTSYTLARVDMQNENVNDGLRFPAPWDRRHQFTVHAEWPIAKQVRMQATWYYATGVPNHLAYDNPLEPTRLPEYHRLDAGINWTANLGAGDASRAVFAVQSVRSGECVVPRSGAGL